MRLPNIGYKSWALLRCEERAVNECDKARNDLLSWSSDYGDLKTLARIGSRDADNPTESAPDWRTMPKTATNLKPGTVLL